MTAIGKKVEDLSDQELLREITTMLRRGGLAASLLGLAELCKEARHRLAQETDNERHRNWYKHPIRRCCPQSARCRGPFHDIRRWLRALDGPGFPQDGLTSHFGESFKHGRIRVSIAEHGSHLFLGLYPDAGAVSKDLIRSWLKQSGKIDRVIKWWEGASHGRGVSIVFARRCPASLLTAISNYHALGSEVFHHEKHEPRYDKFDAWLKRRLEERKG